VVQKGQKKSFEIIVSFNFLFDEFALNSISNNDTEFDLGKELVTH
jgi:hypothetical protein